MSCPKPADSAQETSTVILQAEQTVFQKKQGQHMGRDFFFPKDTEENLKLSYKWPLCSSIVAYR